ncbi:MAG: glycosyltransferase family 87 protein [Chloroflexota bacterium]
MSASARRPVGARIPLALGLAIVGALFLLLAFALLQRSPGWGFDVEAYLWAGHRVALGESPYWAYTLAGPFSPGPWGIYLYAPPLSVAFVPLTLLSQGAVVVGWYLARVVLLAVGCWALPVGRTTRLLVFAVGAFSQPVIVDLVLGNVSVLVFFLVALAWRGVDRPLGMAATALAMSVRPTIGLVLLWSLVRGRLRFVVGTTVAGGVLVAITLPVVGLAGYRDYLVVLGNVTQMTGVANNNDLASTLLRLGLAPAVATAALYGGYILAIGAACWSLRYDRDLSFVVTVSATMLLAPLLWDHYLVSLMIPAAYLADRGRTWGLALPLLAWLPAPLLPFVAIAATLLPFVARHEPAPAGPGGAPALDASPLPGILRRLRESRAGAG